MLPHTEVIREIDRVRTPPTALSMMANQHLRTEVMRYGKRFTIRAYPESLTFKLSTSDFSGVAYTPIG
jgi:hypothetical protein